MSLTADQLYALLPAIYRTRDAENGMPLQALLTVMAAQGAILEENIQQLYDDQFIETCASWAIPYIGDLVGSNPIYEISGAAYGRRAEVANTIGYRRRKGTLLALEQVAMDVSGLRAAAVEFFRLAITNESMKHLRPGHAATLDLRNGSQLAKLDSAFDTVSRTVAVRRIGPRVRTTSQPDPTPLAINLHGGGKYNVPDVGVYLWRWKPNVVSNQSAFQVDARRYLFHPLGQDMPLFNQLPPRDSFSRLTGRLDVPEPIERREFFDNPGAFYGPGQSIQLVADNTPVDVSNICVRDLSDQGAGAWNGCTAKGKYAIDPQLGRIQLAADVKVPAQLRVNYVYGFPADLGGGPYDRSANLPSLDPKGFAFHAVVGSAATPTLELAIHTWNSQPPGTSGLIILPAFETYSINLTKANAIVLPSESRLFIVAAQVEPGGIPGLSGARVTLRGQIEISGKQIAVTDVSNPPPAGQLVWNGVWISGSVQVDGDPTNVQFSDCTLFPGIAPGKNGLPASPGEASVVVNTPGSSLSLVRSISGPVGVAPGATTRICTSIVDSSSRCSVAYAGPDLASEGADLHIEDSTVIGKVHVHTMEMASSTIFLSRRATGDPWLAAVWCSRRQSGCMRFCFVPTDSITPRRFRCLPEDPNLEEALLPKFVTLECGRPSYGLLSGDCPLAIWTGADNGSQMGVYKPLEETEAVRNVQLRIPEFLPFNLEAGVFLEPSAPVVRPAPPAGYGYGYRKLDPCGDPESELGFMGIGAHLI
ncbi:MAG TPA: hypothetical protein VLY04_17250 [Bryobacteraceae bacterium]|nr:hypothetical protein [Bryobacteraceae bacterium]